MPYIFPLENVMQVTRDGSMKNDRENILTTHRGGICFKGDNRGLYVSNGGHIITV